MIFDPEKEYGSVKMNTFDKLMLNTIRSKEDEFQFEGNHYTVCSDGVCVQTLINDRVLYRIFIDKDKNNILVNH